ncbi:MAG: PHP domain-containing protein [Ktedonobacterales bacterium]|nr:PHP domain-containing protein [Ktedonobacterales bacterium]
MTIHPSHHTMPRHARAHAITRTPSDRLSGQYGLADLHTHTHHSDGTGSVEDVLAFAQEHTQLDVLAITDHDTIEGALRARELAAGRYRFEVIIGEEISTREGHMLALFLRAPIPPDLSIERSIELVHAQGGLAIVAHPFNRVFRHSVQRSVMNRLLRQPELHPDGIETLNGSFAGIGSSRIAMGLAHTTYHWAQTGGSDAHTPTAVGCAHTVFLGHTAEELRAAVLARTTSPQGRYWQAREYVSFVSHRMTAGGAATHDATSSERTPVARSRWIATARHERQVV